MGEILHTKGANCSTCFSKRRTYGAWDVFGDFDEKSVIQSKYMAAAISKVCSDYKVEFMNAADYAEASLVDNIHMDEENHGKLAEAIGSKLREML